MKNKFGKIIAVILVILWMILVFWFSGQVGDDSKVTSGNTIRKIVKIFATNIDKESLENVVEALQPFARKVAHFTLYTLGGIIIYNAYNTCLKKLNNKIPLALVTGMLYAITDEIHQYFVPGRSCRAFDVFIDSCGTFTGILICILILKIISKIAKSSSNEQIKKEL